MTEEQVRNLICSMLMDLSESLDSRIYWEREAGNRDVANALEEVKESINSTIEQAGSW